MAETQRGAVYRRDRVRVGTVLHLELELVLHTEEFLLEKVPWEKTRIR